MAIYNRFFISSFTVLLLFFSVIQVVTVLKNPLYTGFSDFGIYHSYTNIFLAGKSPYDPFNTHNKPFAYPPSALIFYLPFSLIPIKESFLIFTAVSLLLYLLTSYLLLKKFFNSRYLVFLILALLLIVFPVKFTLETGQVNLIILSFLNLVFILDQNKKKFLSGLIWGLAIMIKPTPVFLAIYFILGRKFLTLFSGLFLFFISNFILLNAFPEFNYYWSTVLPHLSKTDFHTFFYDQSLFTFLLRLGLPHQISIPRIIIFILFCLAIWRFLIHKKSLFSDLILYSQILTLGTIGNSFAWQHHFVLIQPALISALLIYTRKKNWPHLLLLLLSYILIAFNIPERLHPNPHLPFNSNSLLVSHTLIGALTLFFLLLYA